MTFYEPQSCSLPACKRSKLPKFQTPSPTCTLGPRPLPNRHPRARAKATSPTGTQGQATAMAFYGLSKLPFASPQTLQNSPNAPNPPKPAKPSKHRPQQAPQIHSNDFLEAFKAAVCQPAKAATPPKFQTPSLTGGQGHSNDFLWPGHSNGFLWAFKAAVCQPANPPKLSKRSKPSKTRQTLQTPSPAGTPDPQQ